MLPQDRLPSCLELLATPFFDRRVNKDHGTITMMGVDDCGHEIYFVGQRGSPRLLENIVQGLACHFDIPARDFKLVNVLGRVNLWMRIGGKMSRGLNWVKPGRPLVTWGTARAYRKILKLTWAVKSQCEPK